MSDFDFNQVFPGKWFIPILERLYKFEDEMGTVFPEFGFETLDDAPDWSFQCFLKGNTSFSDYHGAGSFVDFGALRLGKIMGAKWAFSAGWSRSAKIWPMLNSEQIAKIDGVWGEGFVAEAIIFSQRYSEDFHLKFQQLKRYALELAEEQNFQDLIDYSAGFTRGLETPRKIREILMKTTKKRLMDEQKRLVVLSFGFLEGKTIEDHKADLSWPEIANSFHEFVDHKMEVDEDTVKKILQRTGLKGVGKAGRPIKE